MNIACPLCRSSVALEDVNVANDIALCRRCGKTWPFSEIASGPESGGPDLANPPAGAWFVQIADGFRVGASTRSWGALIFVPFALLWAAALLSTVFPRHIPSPGHVTVAFGVPFSIAGIALTAICAMTLAGRVELSRSGETLTVFSGVGGIGFSRRYAWPDFRIAREAFPLQASRWHQEGQSPCLVLEGRRRITFGALWNTERRYFVLAALRKMLRESNPAPAPPPPRPIFR